MAFIREYSEAGDPFSLRRPKWLRKIKPGKLLVRGVKGAAGLVRKVAPSLVGFIPGVGGIASRLFSLTDRYGLPRETAVEFARSYGLDIGDPDAYDTEEAGRGMSGYMGEADEMELDYMGDPAPKPSRKRKNAASGPRAKAAKKREKRAERSQRRRGPSIGTRIKRGLGSFDPAILGNVAEIAAKSGLLGKDRRDATFAGAGGEDALLRDMEKVLSGGRPTKGTGGAFRMGGKRRTMNPANVKALRRGIRRVEGFQTLVKRVHKMFPALRGPTTGRSTPRRSKGHRAGCGCVVCKRAA